MTPAELSPITVAQIHKLIDDACKDTDCGLPWAEAILVGDGSRLARDLFAYSSKQSTKSDGIFWLASCTKLVTSIACMQLFEQGKLDLDNPDQVEKFCPELGDVKVLQDDGLLVDKDARITLRMLLTHTAGFGYSFLNDKLRNYDEFAGTFMSFSQPLVNQPGARFEYGINHDWAGILIERVAGVDLETYFRENIFKPLGMQDMSLVPSAEMIRRCVGIWHREANGKLLARQYPLSRPIHNGTREDLFQSGGGGLFGSIKDFSKILGTLLNDGSCPWTGNTIISSASVQEMFRNQLSEWPNFARQPLPAIKPSLVYPASELYPLCPSTEPQGWGLGFMISPSVTGRSSTTAHWSGLSNVFWWCDREKGVAGVVASQVLPFVDPKVAALWTEVERTVYQSL